MTSTNIQCEKNNHSVLLIIPKIGKKINRKKTIKKLIFLAYFGPLKANYRLFLRLLTLHDFFLTLINVFYMYNTIPSISVSTIFSFCVFIFTFSFLLFSPRNTFYNLQCFISFHCKLPVTLRR